MALSGLLTKLLDREGVAYRVLPHRQEYTAARVAAAAHVPGGELAKAILVRDGGGEFLMAVLPSHHRLDLAALVRATGRERLALATEEDLARLFPDCEVGAMPPFGGLYGLPVYVDSCFRQVPEFVFQGGSHHEVVAMSFTDYLRLAEPLVGQFCFHDLRRKSA
jgi:Ala-tRNA(Pro) deacylase